MNNELWVHRIAEVIVVLPGGRGRRGTGYLVAEDKVLTAAHVVAEADRIQVRFDADRPQEWKSQAEVAWSHAGIDVAVLTCAPDSRHYASGERQPGGVPRTRFGRVAERDAVLSCSAAGFPRFKLRTDRGDPASVTQYRDIEHVRATCALLSNRREGTFDLTVPAPAAPAMRDESPWQGMSGAALFSRGACIGIVARHHLADGLGRLAASRVDRWSEHLTTTERQSLEALLGTGISMTDLVDVTPPREPVRPGAALEAELEALAPRELLDRADELRDLIRFCAGDEPYLWLQGPPWAGKTALVAAFALNPPQGVVPVWFFATTRYAGHDDGQAYLDAVRVQLAELAGQELNRERSAAVRQGEFRSLLHQAASAVATRGEVLLLIVDGLDEDRYFAQPPSRRREPSISSLLPQDTPTNLRVIVTSRPGPGIADDVPGDHPLRASRICELAPSAAARHTQHEARRELTAALDDPVGKDVVGLLAAARGGFSARDLHELTGLEQQDIQRRLKGDFGRMLTPQAQADGRTGYVFGHATLLETAKQELRDGLDGYWSRVTAWAQHYERRGWPQDTPAYLLIDYGQMVAQRQEYDRLLELAGDSRRTAQMHAVMGNDAAALDELETAQQQLTHPLSGSLDHDVAIAAARHVIGRRNAALHPHIPPALARLGRFSEARDLSRGIRVPELLAYTLAGIAWELAQSGRHASGVELADEAVELIRASQVNGIRIGAGEEPMFAVTRADNETLHVSGTALDSMRGLGATEHPDRGSYVSLEELRWHVVRAAACALKASGEPDRARRLADDLLPMAGDVRERRPGSVHQPDSPDGYWQDHSPDEDQRKSEEALCFWALLQVELAGIEGPNNEGIFGNQDPGDEALLRAAEGAAEHLPPALRVSVLTQLAVRLGEQEPARADQFYDLVQRLGRESAATTGSALLQAACARALRETRPGTAVAFARAAKDALLGLLGAIPSHHWDRLVFWQRVTEEGAACVRALADVGLLPEAMEVRNAVERVYGVLRTIAREEMRAGVALLATVIPPDDFRRESAFAIARAQLAVGQGRQAGRTLHALWREVPATRWHFGTTPEDVPYFAGDAPSADATRTRAFEELLAVVRREAENYPWAVAGVLVSVAKQLPSRDRDRALGLLTEARRLDLGNVPDKGVGPNDDRCWANLAAALAGLGQADDVSRALQSIRDPLVHDIAYLHFDSVGDPRRLRGQTDPVSDMFVTASTLERLARNGESELVISLAPHLSYPQMQSLATVAAKLWAHAPSAAKKLWKSCRQRLSREMSGAKEPEHTAGLALLVAAARGRYRRGTQQVLKDLQQTAVEAANAGWPHCLMLLALALCPDDRRAASHWLTAAEHHQNFRPTARSVDWIAVHALTQAATGQVDAAVATASRPTDEQDRAEVQALVAGYLVGAAQPPISSRLRFLTPQFLPPALHLLEHIPPPADARTTALNLTRSALRTSFWHEALPVLTVLDPAGVRRARRVLFDAYDTDASGQPRNLNRA
ncbi:trypsin-like peptidase domain-containing protein [Streptomyces atacamensis]|uniref:trypsin-like peptidase domain-containing protein n=1 Tax=Streptomyces atacamensis TaxID=531966 RepID=UPI00399CE1B0